MMENLFSIASFILNLLLLPLLAVLWDIRIKITRLETTVCSQGARLTNVEDRINRHLERSQITP